MVTLRVPRFPRVMGWPRPASRPPPVTRPCGERGVDDHLELTSRRAPQITLRARATFGRLKNALFFARDGLNTTIDPFNAELDAYIRWYNEARIKISRGSLAR